MMALEGLVLNKEHVNQMELGVDKTSLVKVCKAFCNKDLNTGYSPWLLVIDIIKLLTEYEEKAINLVWKQNLGKEKKVSPINLLSSSKRYVKRALVVKSTVHVFVCGCQWVIFMYN